MKKGFTILEVIVASGILILALTALVTTFVMSKKSAVIADNRTEAIHLSRYYLEFLSSKPYGDSTYLSVGAHNLGNYQNQSMTSLVYRLSYWVTQNTGTRVTSKNIYLTNRWVSPVGAYGTSEVVMCTSIAQELHP